MKTIVQYQQQYQEVSTQSQYKPSIKTWTAKFINAIWNFTFAIWETRNKKIHDTKIVEDLQGRKLLEAATRREWEIGISTLPLSEYASLFRRNVNSLITGPLPQLKRWFSIIRNARILLKDPRLISDEFTTNNTLKTWAGIIDKDAAPQTL